MLFYLRRDANSHSVTSDNEELELLPGANRDDVVLSGSVVVGSSWPLATATTSNTIET